jgi:sulfoxide reductase heme-binding subunit YedZ
MRINGTGVLSARGKRHLLLGTTVLLLVTILYVLLGYSPERWIDIPDRKADTPLWRFSMSLAYTTLIFLSLTLAIGPYRILRGIPVPVNIILRRDLGYWAGGLALTHGSTAIWIHTGGWSSLWGLYLWRLPSREDLLPIRNDLFGMANFLGTGAALLILILILTSNNATLKRLRTRTWKNLQRLSYPAYLLMVLHGLLYQIVENRLPMLRLAVMVMAGLLIVLQVSGLILRLTQRDRSVEPARGWTAQRSGIGLDEPDQKNN